MPMSVRDTLRADLKEALQQKDERRSSTLRLLFAAIQNKEIEERKKEVGLADEEIIDVIKKEAKKRKDAIGEYEKANRTDRADNEKKELEILETYLPQELLDDEIIRIIQDGIREIGAVDESSYGALMKVIMSTLKGRASGDRIARLARQELARHPSS